MFTAVEALLFRTDPIGINFDDNTDESAETGTILPRLKKSKAPEDVMVVVHEEFVRWAALKPQGL